MPHHRVRKLIIATILTAILLSAAACSPFKPEPRVSPEGELPQTYGLYMLESPPPDKWWEQLDEPELDALIDKALAGSFSLKEAWARLNQTHALAVKSGAALYPDLSITAGATKNRLRTENETSSDTATTENYSLGLASSYELDLWGRITSENQTALLTARASREDLNTVAITLAAEVALRWTEIISQGMQKRLLVRQLQTNLTMLELVELRFRKSMASALDFYQQKQVVEQVKAEIPLVEQQEQLQRHELALLLGKPPRTRLDIQRQNVPIPNELPATGLPADLLATRPDVRAAGLQLRAADWQVASARANRLPTISLTANAGYQSDEMDFLLDNWLLSLAANLVVPILDGRRRSAEVDRTRAISDEKLWNYRDKVISAIKEVEDALVSETKQREYIKGLELQIDAARKALEQAGERYRGGLSDYLPVLTQLLAVQGLERNLIRQQALLFTNRINLYRALGGAWPNELKPPQEYSAR